MTFLVMCYRWLVDILQFLLTELDTFLVFSSSSTSSCVLTLSYSSCPQGPPGEKGSKGETVSRIICLIYTCTTLLTYFLGTQMLGTYAEDKGETALMELIFKLLNHNILLC